ncbi:MAG: hypothetical protein ACE5EI_01260 [Thermodesulfobacteriota bacterium]
MARKIAENPRTIHVRATSFVVAFAFVIFSFLAAAPPSHAQDETLGYTLKSTVYGGIIGGLVGTAVLLVSDRPEDKLSYIPTGVGVGLLLGAAYGLATGGTFRYAAVEAGRGGVAFHFPEVERIALYDENTAETEVISKADLLKVRF